MSFRPVFYTDILEQLKAGIRAARGKAALAVNFKLFSLFWRVGNFVLAQQQAKGWDAKVIEVLSDNIRRDFTDLQGFSYRNLLYMRQVV
jgi:hypothetical protein